jgi:hypothetical protein
MSVAGERVGGKADQNTGTADWGPDVLSGLLSLVYSPHAVRPYSAKNKACMCFSFYVHRSGTISNYVHHGVFCASPNFHPSRSVGFCSEGDAEREPSVQP